VRLASALAWIRNQCLLAAVLSICFRVRGGREPPRSRLIRVGQALKALVTRRAADTPMH